MLKLKVHDFKGIQLGSGSFLVLFSMAHHAQEKRRTFGMLQMKARESGGQILNCAGNQSAGSNQNEVKDSCIPLRGGLLGDARMLFGK